MHREVHRMKIEADKQQVYRNIMQLTAVSARNRQNMSIAVTEDNLPAMGIYLAEAVTEAENELRRHLKSSTGFTLYADESSIVMDIKDLMRAAESTYGQMKSSLILYITHYAISRWVSDIDTAKDLAEPYSNSAGGYLSKLQSLVCQRDEYTVDADSYLQRQQDEIEMAPGSTGLMADAEIRQRDLQPVRKVWPAGICADSASNILQDGSGNIIVSKT